MDAVSQTAQLVSVFASRHRASKLRAEIEAGEVIETAGKINRLQTLPQRLQFTTTNLAEVAQRIVLFASPSTEFFGSEIGLRICIQDHVNDSFCTPDYLSGGTQANTAEQGIARDKVARILKFVLLGMCQPSCSFADEV